MSLTWIEASAGTGKTYTLVQTVLRLVVEEALPVERILLVTFTDKATAELKSRIREGLRAAWKDKKSDKNPLLARALENLASLSVTTIHGFCRTLLTQFPLESGVSFEPEMVDQGRQWRRLLRDELRPQLTTLDPELLAWAGLEDEERLLALAREALDRNLFQLPLLHPTPSEQDVFQRCRADLEAGRGPLWEALEGGRHLMLPADSSEGLGATTIAEHLHASWHRRPYQAVRSLLAARNVRDLRPLLDAETLDLVAKWTIPPGAPRSLWKKGSSGSLPPVLGDLVAVAQDLTLAAEALVSAVPGVGLQAFLEGAARHRVLDSLCRPVLERRSARELTFHDLIDRVRTLVTAGQTGVPGLREGAAARWQAVLIDEFQDTDPEQWDIFRSLFADAEHQLILVGDPKQSIYRFRGADLDVYRAVREQVKARGAQTLVLQDNYRSTAPMIEAVNRLFDPSVAPWDHPDDFTPSKKGNKPIARLVRRTAVEEELPPLAVYHDHKGVADRDWHRHLVRTVTHLLDGTHFLDDGTTQTPLSPGDVLVLVRKKKEAWALYRLLTARGVPATVGGSGGLLRGREAQEALLFLKALEAPRSLSAGRALTWTKPFAGAALDALMPALDEAQADRDRGAFLRAFRRVAAALEPDVPDGGGLERLLALPEGPRIVTNLEHVLELVQERFHRGEVAPGKAALALETWIQSGLQEDEVDLRRDGEARTLRLMTVHAAKGLEAPVVLHGVLSSDPEDRSAWIVHQGVDFLKTEDSRAAEEGARKAEALRLRYVALTRAKCHQVFLDPDAGLEVPPADLDLGRYQAAPDEGAPEPVLAPSLRGLESRHPWVESHSGLWRRATREEGTTHTVWDRPQRGQEDEAPSLDSEVDQLPAGPAFGDLVHDVLEGTDFRAAAPNAEAEHQAAWTTEVEELCLRQRSLFQGRDLSRPLQAWLRRALNHPFTLGEDTRPLVFSSLSPENTRRELEFHLPLAPGAPPSFDWSGRTFAVHPGFLTGRIDLLFRWEGRLYLADWKTNRLAPGQPPEEVMAEAGYDLQAQWYWEALRRLCALQNEPALPGGVLYVFLRGQGALPSGVFLGPEALDTNATLSPFLREVPHG